MAQCSPCRAILSIDISKLKVVFNGMMVFTIGRTILSQLVQIVNVHKSIVATCTRCRGLHLTSRGHSTVHVSASSHS